MASAFSQAWKLLKQFSNPHDEEEMQRQNASFAPDPRMESQEGDLHQITHEPFRPTEEPPNPFPRKGGPEPQRGSMTPMEMERMMQRLEESQRGYPSDMVEGDEPQLYDYEPPERDFDDKAPQHNDFDAGRPQTVPMSPRGSVRGKGERQAFDKPKKPDWWRTLSGE